MNDIYLFLGILSLDIIILRESCKSYSPVTRTHPSNLVPPCKSGTAGLKMHFFFFVFYLFFDRAQWVFLGFLEMMVFL